MDKTNNLNINRCVIDAERIAIKHLEPIMGIITSKDINRDSRKPVSSYSRFVVWHILNRKHRMSHAFIGRVYGKHHSSIKYGLERAKYLGLIKNIGC